MEPENEMKKQINPFYCNICKIWCSSALNLQTHFLGSKHKAIEEALKAHGMVETDSCSGKILNTPANLPDFVKAENCLGKKGKTPAKLPDFVPLEPGKVYGPDKFNGQTLEDHLNTCKDTEPALGLNYIIEYRSKDNIPFLYECQLCHCKTGLSSMFMHVCGSKHRLAYLRQHYPEIALSEKVTGRGSELNKKVRQVGLTIEKREGRKQIRVVTRVRAMRRKWPEFFSAEDNPSKPKVQHVDVPFSEQTDAEQIDNKDGKLTDPTQDENSVQEENEEGQKEKAKPDETVEPNSAIESSEGNNSERCETNEQSEEENKEDQEEFTENAEEFTSQGELLAYLQSFEILNEDDASFILKVTQTLTNALVEYRQQAASNEDHLGAGYNGETALEYSTEQPGLTSAGYSGSQSAEQFLPVSEDEPQNFSAGSLETAYENNITTAFLHSVRNMNAEEVTTTLHKIASNPAFRGIDIPNVTRILTESGTLMVPSNGSTQ
uniref:U1-type domain-containing protein n=1 Tax=Cyanoderma ruficeps TaxID=181631 RepID=A0A8C3R4N0_9PASS